MVIYNQLLGDQIRRLSEQHMISYEQPLNEKIRLFLRLELLTERFEYHVSGEPMPENTVAALHLLLDLYNLSARLDIKSEILKEIDRIGQSTRMLLRDENADVQRLDKVLEKLNFHSDVLYQQRGQLGQHLKNHMFFNSLRQRSSLPGGINGFDIPLFNYWQRVPVEERLGNLREWVAPYVTANAAVQDILNLMREFCERRDEVGKEGFFQSTLEGRKPYQMMRVELQGEVDYYPEISAGKQRFTLRFVNADMLADRGKQVNENVPFTLALCNF
ncbi:MAG: cell division protein ZapD [Gammaproteobacteria bacterium]|nr:cell division protein ZapD [Gammaproteobacteria bacterium]MBU1724924.1 cell division protein ZapD [Gammaproteobacteria bacterium]MBU2003742.1 cell division protein ZapD [Gammaproteobacteria bacterium]